VDLTILADFHSRKEACMRTLVLFIFTIILSMAAPAWSQDADISAVQLLERLQQRFGADGSTNSIHNVQAEFYQQAHIASLNRTQTGRGTMSMLFENHKDNGTSTLFHWSYTVPNEQQVISDGKTLWVYIPDNNQVMVSAINDKSYYTEDPLLFLRNLGQLSRHFSVKWAEPSTDSSNKLLELTPLQPSVYIKSIVITLPQWLLTSPNQAGFPLYSASIIDPTDNKTSLEFRRVTINQEIDRQQFNFTVPPGVDVVHPADLTLDFK